MNCPAINIKYNQRQVDEQEFTEIYNRYWKRMYDLAGKLLQCEAAAKDCVQEVFVAFWKRRSEHSIGNLESYLLQSIRFQVCKTIRNKKTGRRYTRVALYSSPEFYFCDPAALREMKDGFSKTILALPVDQRIIFYLNREESVSYPRIAEHLGISVKTVEKKMSRTLKSLRELVETI